MATSHSSTAWSPPSCAGRNVDAVHGQPGFENRERSRLPPHRCRSSRHGWRTAGSGQGQRRERPPSATLRLRVRAAACVQQHKVSARACGSAGGCCACCGMCEAKAAALRLQAAQRRGARDCKSAKRRPVRERMHVRRSGGDFQASAAAAKNADGGRKAARAMAQSSQMLVW